MRVGRGQMVASTSWFVPCAHLLQTPMVMEVLKCTLSGALVGECCTTGFEGGDALLLATSHGQRNLTKLDFSNLRKP
jgi:hypothetical protein